MNYQVKLIGKQVEIPLNRPLNIKIADYGFFDEKYLTTPFYIVVAQNAFMTKSGIVGKNFKINQYSIPHYKGKKAGFYKQYLYNFLTRKRQKFEEALVIHNPWCPGYFHWITEALVRLFLYEKSRKNQNIPILLPIQFKELGYVLDSIASLSKRDIIFLEKNHIAKIQNLHFVSNPTYTGFYHKDIIEGLKKKILRALPELPGRAQRKIYVTRKDANNRLIVNEEEVVALLVQYDFEVVSFEQMTFLEQVSLMQETRLLISIHGAGLTNLMFMAKGGSILEFQLTPNNSHNYSNLYFKLSAISNINYLYQFCPPAERNRNIYNADLIVDIELLKSNLSIMLSTIA